VTVHLNFWKQKLGSVPDSVWAGTDIETLVLADNDLAELPDRFGSLRQLRMLDLGHNQLTRLPDSLGDLEGLTDFLYLHDNRLTSLPASLGKLTRLKYLNVSENPLEEFPGCIRGMTNLVELRLCDDRLATLPDSIAHANAPARASFAKQPPRFSTCSDWLAYRIATARSARKSASRAARRIAPVAQAGKAGSAMGVHVDVAAVDRRTRSARLPGPPMSAGHFTPDAAWFGSHKTSPTPSL
jgi:Leucine rich repeat